MIIEEITEKNYKEQVEKLEGEVETKLKQF
ncbi:hypothetical protein LCGC14_2323730 [marine sediment metagenome]|uniref:Uncharacterized protein n=1 Tax=marine sediment metagenome TaxID=412755 RepID=A0A0F9FBT1_9ZZZZ